MPGLNQSKAVLAGLNLEAFDKKIGVFGSPLVRWIGVDIKVKLAQFV